MSMYGLSGDGLAAERFRERARAYVYTMSERAGGGRVGYASLITEYCRICICVLFNPKFRDVPNNEIDGLADDKSEQCGERGG